MVKKRSLASCREVEGGGGRISTGYSSSLRSTAATTVSKEGENACSNSRLQNSSRSQHFSLQTEDFCFSISRMSCFRFLRSSHPIVVWGRQTCSDWNFEKKKKKKKKKKYLGSARKVSCWPFEDSSTDLSFFFLQIFKYNLSFYLKKKKWIFHRGEGHLKCILNVL